MSAHSSRAMKCACGAYFLFSEYHWPHCSRNPQRAIVSGRKESLFEKPPTTAKPLTHHS